MLVVLFAEPVARDTTEEVGTELLGTQVDVARLDLLPKQASVDLGGLQIADPFEPRRNLVEAAGSVSSSIRRRWPRRSWWWSGS